MDRLIGRTLGDFRILDLLGQGSMARVYRAVQVSLDRPVALKVFQEGILTPGDFARRFRREAEYLARFEHPNILPVYAAGQEGEFHFFALRLVAGGTLAHWLETPRAPQVVVATMRDVASGLACLHARGGIHRDLKPSNVLIEGDSVLLADFGLARLIEESTITQSGAMLGTPLYMSPEQMRRERATSRSDVFALGVMLYEALAGRHPFSEAATGSDVRSSDVRGRLLARVEQEAAPRLEVPGLPQGLVDLVARCLRSDPAERFADGGDLLAAIDAVEWPEGETATRPGRAGLPPTVLSTRKQDVPPTPEPTPSRPEGTPFGRYVLVSELGHGGMGIVYRAWDTVLSRFVAVKVLQAGELAGADAVVRFEREARAAAKLRHPGIVQVHDVGQCEGRRYFTMDLIEGKNLGELLRDESLSLEEVLCLLLQVAYAVDHAHRNGLIHRDLKPANVVVEGGDRAIVTDFGLALDVTAPRGPSSTLTGEILGTPSYMSPEQARGARAEIDARTDVYALGVILYEALTRHRPFDGDDVVSILHAVQTWDPAPPRQVNPAVPHDLEVICLKAMMKSPARRYPSAEAFASDLEHYLRHEPILARPAGWLYRLTRRIARNRAAFASGAVAALALIVLAGSWAYRRMTIEAELAGTVPLAEAAWERGELDVARRLYERIAVIAPERLEDRERLRLCEDRQSRIEQLLGGVSDQREDMQLAVWNEIVSLNPKKASYLRERGLCRLRLRHLIEAEADLRAAMDLDPHEVFAGVYLWSLYTDHRNDVKKAGEVLAEALRRDPASWVTWLQQASQHLECGRSEDALNAIERVLALRPGFLPGLVMRGAVKRKLGDLEGARADFEAALKADSRMVRARIGLSHTLRDERRFTEAEREARLAAEVDPASALARDELGAVLMALGRFDEAEKEWSAAAQIDPSDPAPRGHRAHLRLWQGRLDEALADAEAALARDPTHAEALFARGMVRLRAGDVQGAEADLEAARRRSPEDPCVLNGVATLFIVTGRAAEAIDLLDPLVSRYPDETDLRETRAGARYGAGDWPGAEADYEEVARRDPRRGQAHYGVGLCRMKADDGAAAIEAFGRAIDCGYGDAHYNRGVLRLERKDLEGALEDFLATVENDSSPSRRDSARKTIPGLKRQLGLPE